MSTLFDTLRTPFVLRTPQRTTKAWALSLVAAALMMGCGGDDAESQAGKLDVSFGTASDGTPDGIVNLSLGSGNDNARAVAVQADGRIVVVGFSTSTGGLTSNIVVERFNTDGTLDTGFGAGNADGSPDGVVSLDLGASSDVARAVKIQSDGKIVVAGTRTPDGETSNIILARLNIDGTLDATFGAGDADGTPDGVVSVDLGSDGDDVASALAVQANGKLLVAGYTYASGSGTKNVMVARVNADGTLDASFGTGSADGTPDGVVSVSFSTGDDEANAMTLQTDGKILLAGTTIASDSSTNAVVARLNTDGSLDATFGVGNADGTPDGVVSASFSNGNDAARAIALQADGKIVVAGITTATDSSTNAVVARFNADGTLDSSFGTSAADGTPDGVVGISLGSGNDTAQAVVVQDDGRIVLAGTSTATDTSSNAMVARLNANGTLDTSFGQDAADGTPEGVVGLSMGADDDLVHALTLQADGKILLVGDRVNAGSSDIWIARLLAR